MEESDGDIQVTTIPEVLPNWIQLTEIDQHLGQTFKIIIQTPQRESIVINSYYETFQGQSHRFVMEVILEDDDHKKIIVTFFSQFQLPSSIRRSEQDDPAQHQFIMLIGFATKFRR